MPEKFRLRPLAEGDLQLILAWRNSDKIRLNMFNTRLITCEEHRQWYEKMITSQRSDFRIFEVGGKPAGVVNFTDIDVINSSCFWGFYLGTAGLPKGTGLIMGYMGLDYAFNELSMRKISGECFTFNVASIKFHERLGFRREGHFLAHICRDEKCEDVLRFAIFKHEWLQWRRELQKMLFGEED